MLFGLNAVDELDRTAFAVLLPEIRDDFGLDLQAVLTLIGVVYLGALLLQVPIANLADRHSRVRIAWIGALVWGVFSLMTGMATTIVLLAIARSGSAIGKAVVDPTHNSLIADYYDVGDRPRVYSFHRAANAVGGFVGPLVGGLVGAAFGWRWPFLVFAIPTLVFVVLALRLREPLRGAHERRAMGASEEAIHTEEPAPSFAEAWRMVWKIESLRRIWYSLPFLAASLIGFASLAGLVYEEVFDLDERARGLVIGAVEPAQLVGLIYGARMATRLMARGPGAGLRFLSHAAWIVAAALVVFALAPNIAVAVVAHAVITAILALLLPGILASLSLAIPPAPVRSGSRSPRCGSSPASRSCRSSAASATGSASARGCCSWSRSSSSAASSSPRAGHVIAADIAEVWRGQRRPQRGRVRAPPRPEPAAARARPRRGVRRRAGALRRRPRGRRGRVRRAARHERRRQVDACCSAISGVVEADRGAVIFDGREITHAPPNEIAAFGVAQVPGGQGVFPSLTVAENLRTAAWLAPPRRRSDGGVEHVLRACSRSSATRSDDPAGDLSGGQQQMLALGMAFLAAPPLADDRRALARAGAGGRRPAPPGDRAMRADGTTVILVEQSVNVALTVADTAYFMEKGEIRFHGPTAELLERPDAAALGLPRRRDAAVSRATATRCRPRRLRQRRGGGRRTAGPRDRRADPRASAASRAVDRVSLTVAPAEIVGIIGPNGAGKTTLFDLVSGFVRADSGAVMLGGTAT